MLLCVTASHKTAPFDLLEQLSSPSAEAVAPLIARTAPEVRGAVVLATCNRFEAYIETGDDDSAGVQAALGAIEAATGVARDDLAGSYEVKRGGKVAEHLFAVASGLESVVIGEGEIGGQVRRALAQARAQGTTSSELERLFQRATETQKGVKNTTALGRAGRSLVRLALELADSRLADWTTQRVLLVGTGAYAAATLAALRDRGVTDITVFSPSGRGQKFAAKHGIAWTTREDYPGAAAASDLVITCTTSEDPVLDAALLREGGLDDRLFVIDLGLPRNVDPDVAELDHVTLLDLETIRLHAPLEELQATETARAMVKDAAARFHLVGRQQSAQPAVVALREHVFGLLEDEIARVRRRSDAATARQTEQALRHLVGVLLHAPTTRAQDLAVEGRADEVFAAVEALFGVDVRGAEQAEGDAATGCPFPGEARSA
ncbi:glutamyl-tRNA reductase [Microbacterium album]|uniref:Glutamyl-tRNA reductase n=1 Tax=Microbacterium album TaxID=2053191 RepID=A0A917IIZ4_9MICO|nr:glutamyl-tRNA reductase [Microbacterium album]GGH50150.1 glutamyl-tRNA reductase [Microbacterium album]